uniref:Uncharacterized protein n=1 Tax=Rhizophora mucronata TaxID=61149 RepID=A0A2P2IJW0_RHIMU
MFIIGLICLLFFHVLLCLNLVI